MNNTNIMKYELSESQFKTISKRIYTICRIKLNEGKQELVKARLMKRIRALGLSGFGEYISLVEKDVSGKELSEMVDALTTNKTDFFREPAHYRFLCDTVIHEMKGKTFRIWSAGCSSGEEPFSIVMSILNQEQRIIDLKILATDISANILKKAIEGFYDKEDLADVNPVFRQKYFSFQSSSGLFSIRNEVTGIIRFARLNLMEKWPMQRKFDVIFCRNVMIYFDKNTQEKLINRFWDYITKGGYLFVGHSESLAGLKHRFTYVKPAIYRK